MKPFKELPELLIQEKLGSVRGSNAQPNLDLPVVVEEPFQRSQALAGAEFAIELDTKG